MLQTSRREGLGSRLLLDLASDRLSDDELNDLIPLLLADGPPAPEKLVQSALAIPARQRRLLRSA
jgi:hypothetical protein